MHNLKVKKLREISELMLVKKVRCSQEAQSCGQLNQGLNCAEIYVDRESGYNCRSGGSPRKWAQRRARPARRRLRVAKVTVALTVGGGWWTFYKILCSLLASSSIGRMSNRNICRIKIIISNYLRFYHNLNLQEVSLLVFLWLIIDHSDCNNWIPLCFRSFFIRSSMLHHLLYTLFWYVL